MATKNPVFSLEILAMAAKSFGGSLWAPVTDLVTDARASNTPETALSADADINALSGSALYYQNGTFGPQLVLKYDNGTWSYVHFMHDKDGDPIFDENDTYDVKDVRAVRTFDIPGTTARIKEGTLLTKAYTAS